MEGSGQRKMMKLHIIMLELVEVTISSWIHFLYGLYFITTVFVGGLFQQTLFFKKNFNVMLKEDNAFVNHQTISDDEDLPPIVLVHGIFGFGQGKMGGLQYFGGAENKDKRVLVPDLGSLTSIYDRARELFYYLKGGRVDYGEDHSKACGHSQFGNYYEKGHYPQWDENHPIHFVGHSTGAQVARLLHQMLANKEFKGHENTCPGWVLSLTSLSGALNGSTRTYIDGIQPGNITRIKPISLVQKGKWHLVIYQWFDIPWLKSYYNLGLDHFNISRKKMSVRKLIDCLLGKSGPFASGDWILPDLTLEGSMRLNSKLHTFPDTYYFSYATKRTSKIFGITLPSGIFGIHPLMFLSVLRMSQWRLPLNVPPPYEGYRDEDWWDNDGAMNTISMLYPCFPIKHPHRLIVNESDCYPLQAGIWYYKIIYGDHLLLILNRERAGIEFDLVYDNIFHRCRKHFVRRLPHSPLNEV